MLCSLNKLKSYIIIAHDGEIGRIKDFYFDEKNWVIRYLLVDSENYLNRSNGFISTSSISNIDMQSHIIRVNFSSQNIDQNVEIKNKSQQRSKQAEIQFSDFFKRPSYWRAVDLPWVVGPQGKIYDNIQGKNEIRLPASQPNLPSYNQISKYEVNAINAYLGCIKDILIDEDTWQFQFLELDNENWYEAQSTLLPYDLIERLDSNLRNIEVLTDRILVATAPDYDPNDHSVSTFENILDHYKAYSQNRPEYIKRLEMNV